MKMLFESVFMLVGYIICAFGLYILIDIFSNLNQINKQDYLEWKYRQSCFKENTMYFNGVHNINKGNTK